MADQVAISGEFCTFLVSGVAVAASRNFTFKVDAGSYGNFVARGTSKWRTFYASDLGANLDVAGLVVCQTPSPSAKTFADLFTALIGRASVTVVFTLQTDTHGEPRFVYSGSMILTSLQAAAPQFGEATYTLAGVFTGTVLQTTGVVS